MCDEAMDNIQLILRAGKEGHYAEIDKEKVKLDGMCRTYPLVVPAGDLRAYLIPR
jgi:hypothetical protein